MYAGLWIPLKNRRGSFNLGGKGKIRNSSDELHQFALFVQLIECTAQSSGVELVFRPPGCVMGSFRHILGKSLIGLSHAVRALYLLLLTKLEYFPRGSITRSTVLKTTRIVFRGIYQEGAEKGEVYGLSWHMTGITVMAAYTWEQTAIAAKTTYAMMWWILRRETMRPARKRKTET